MTDRAISYLEFRVRYYETDQMGIVHHPKHLVWFENGRIDLLHKCGVSYKEMEMKKQFFPVVSCAAKYLVPACFDDLLVMKTVIVEASPSKVQFGAWLHKPQDAQSGRNVLAKYFSEHAYAGENFVAEQVPQELLDKLTPHIYQGKFFSKRKKAPGI